MEQVLVVRDLNKGASEVYNLNYYDYEIKGNELIIKPKNNGRKFIYPFIATFGCYTVENLKVKEIFVEV